ncbi:unnamed protein product [Rangifer tarandus platyrhynchus]|uniref:Uncharacterized protein n=1 Tax=Rangifer tarandus platyrhynchus TaxID=3082113 RepID=A0ABN8YQI3_RANTA|nr:unnamed protein product [Rangifer tarandus platyrhynchus]
MRTAERVWHLYQAGYQPLCQAIWAWHVTGSSYHMRDVCWGAVGTPDGVAENAATLPGGEGWHGRCAAACLVVPPGRAGADRFLPDLSSSPPPRAQQRTWRAPPPVPGSQPALPPPGSLGTCREPRGAASPPGRPRHAPSRPEPGSGRQLSPGKGSDGQPGGENPGEEEEEEAELGCFKKGKRARSCERPMTRPLRPQENRNEDSIARMAE